jgi:demethylmenaquinone methyltransferase / 2-methoxy-6-polyprenyl-1,4-benzoquinol methylase
MPESYYQSGEHRAERVHQLFTRIARRYDRLNDLQSFWLHRLWKDRLIKLANSRPGEAALDVCCGTGDLAFKLARRGARVVGLDFSDAMLQVARRRSVNNSAISWVQGNASQLPFPNDSFDIITIAYGLRNLANWESGIGEMLRVAKPKARLLILEFGKPANPVWRRVYFSYLRLAVPTFGKLFAGDARAYSYILESLEHYPAPKLIADRFAALRCQVKVVNLLGGAMTIHLALKP